MITVYVTVPDFADPIRVTGIYEPGSPGNLTGRWEDAEEPEPDDLEITSVTVTAPDGTEVDLWQLPPGVIDEAWIEDVETRALRAIRNAR